MISRQIKSGNSDMCCLHDHSLWNAMHTFEERLNRIFKCIAGRYGLTIIQAEILALLYQQGIKTVGTLAEELSMTSGNTSTICKRLEREGYLERVRDREDERIVRLCLTEKGTQISSLLIQDMVHIKGQVVKRYSEQEIENMLLKLSDFMDFLADLAECPK
ncbi:MarR family transcriptional regulator [Anaerolentibacter hominis]|uniref:MarR family winged helix-turn-helix transcriptional regulator n=1 Tax=Anaerolentibacter hominis TaxID=3079009 RepID=UPI0031B8A459